MSKGDELEQLFALYDEKCKRSREFAAEADEIVAQVLDMRHIPKYKERAEKWLGG